MSGKSSFMNKLGFNGKKKSTPRKREEIMKEYQELSSKAANAQYLVFMYGVELEAINRRMLAVNQEASELNKLEAEEAKRQAASQQGNNTELKAVQNVSKS